MEKGTKRKPSEVIDESKLAGMKTGKETIGAIIGLNTIIEKTRMQEMTKEIEQTPDNPLYFTEEVKSVEWNPWILLKDEKPEFGRQCVVITNYGQIGVSVYSSTINHFIMNSVGARGNIVAWFYVPKFHTSISDNTKSD